MNEQMSVLIVDDDKIHKQSLAPIANSDSCQSITLTLVSTLSEVIYREKIDLVLTDIRMPGMDGKILLKKIKAFSKSLPVLLMTAHSSIDEAVELLKLGAADYIPKPISPEVLNHRLDTIPRKPDPDGGTCRF